ncbi:LpxL/LpxP family acyltransferase [Candidatus Lokiarchaeum ossiferum]|uniref:LpxL/LpxP family acyltransferase n=1 Tax=Candidatus Lokiarchaeum ossiferum TaxID=2951803 RepID=UPI00352FDDBA
MKDNQAQKTIKKNRADQLKGFFKLMSFIHRYKLFLPFRFIPPSFLYGFGHLFGHLFVYKPKLRKIMKIGLDCLFQAKISEKSKEKICLANSKYMVSMVFDAMLYSPNIYPHTLSQFIEFENIDYLDQVLLKGNGAIILGTHTGMYFHLIAGLVYHPNKYNVMVINRARNQIMYENILSRPGLTNLHPLAHSNFSELKVKMINHLKSNGVIVILQDYSKKHNLSVPLIEGKYSLLITTPQSAIRIHKISGTTIIPALIHPQGIIGKSLIEFINPAPITQLSARYWDSPGKIFHGELSIAINSIFYPYLLQHLHVWEEFRKFSIRIRDSYEWVEINTLDDFYQSISKKMLSILENSYEHQRNEIALSEIIIEFFSSSSFEQISNLKLNCLNTRVDLTGLNSKQKFEVLVNYVLAQIGTELPEKERLRWEKFSINIQDSYTD